MCTVAVHSTTTLACIRMYQWPFPGGHKYSSAKDKKHRESNQITIYPSYSVVLSKPGPEGPEALSPDQGVGLVLLLPSGAQRPATAAPPPQHLQGPS